MRQTPFRPDNQISQTFNSGTCTVYTQRDIARPGYKPQPGLEWKGTLRYEEQRLGFTRFYTARQNNVDVERVLRVPQPPASRIPNPQDVIRTEDGTLYEIEMVQTVPGVWPKSLDVTLRKFVQVAELTSPSGGGAPEGGGEGPEGEALSVSLTADSSPKGGALGGADE